MSYGNLYESTSCRTVLSLWKGEPTSMKETNGLPTSWRILHNLMHTCATMIYFWLSNIQHCGCWCRTKQIWLLDFNTQIIKSPQSGMTLCFQFLSAAAVAAASSAAAYAAATTFASHVKTAQRIYGSGEMYSMTFSWPWPKVTVVASIIKNLLVCAIKWEPLIGSLQNMAALLHGYYLIRFWRSSVGNFYFGKFSLKNSDVFFQGQTLFWPYLRNGWSDWC